MKVATSLVLGSRAAPKLATQAVTQAMQKADIGVANSVFLLLTSEFANDPDPSIRAAAKAAQCTQVMGCSATGIFTEEDWVLDSPAVAAMVFGDDVHLHTGKNVLQNNAHTQPWLTLTAPNAINSTWLNNGSPRYGGVSGDATGQGPFSVWQNAKGEVSGYVDAFFTGVKMATKPSHGLQLLTAPQCIVEVNGYDVVTLSSKEPSDLEWLMQEKLHLKNVRPPLIKLQKAWQLHCSELKKPITTAIPLHLMMAVYADSAEAILQGNYQQANLIGINETDNIITLAQPLQAGQFISWALRSQAVAEADLMLVSTQLAEELVSQPDFGILFSCLGRGPYFYDGIDKDLKVLTHQFPKMPLIGFYGNGEISCLNSVNQLLPYSAVLSLFSALANE